MLDFLLLNSKAKQNSQCFHSTWCPAHLAWLFIASWDENTTPLLQDSSCFSIQREVLRVMDAELVKSKPSFMPPLPQRRWLLSDVCHGPILVLRTLVVPERPHM